MKKFLFISMLLLSITAFGQKSTCDTSNYNAQTFDWVLYELEERGLKPAIKTEEYRIWINDFKDMPNSWTLVTLTKEEGQAWAINVYNQIKSLSHKKAFKKAANQVNSIDLVNVLNNMIEPVPNNKDLRYHFVDIATTPILKRLDFAVDYENRNLHIHKRMWNELSAHNTPEWIQHLQEENIKDVLLILYPAVVPE